MQPKISIIVPIYNREKELARCLQSLLKQTFKEIEIILINDGSTDDSVELIHHYAEKDERIVVINQNNKGVSIARNQGLLMAKGKYVGFVDSDDWVELTMYERLFQIAEEREADVVMCSYVREFLGGSKEKQLSEQKIIHLQGKQVQTNLLRRLIGPIRHELGQPEMLDAWGTVWSKLYRRDVLRISQATFVNLDEIGTNEDTLFNMQVLTCAQSFVFYNQPFYHYWRGNDKSVTAIHKSNLLVKWRCLFQHIERIVNDRCRQEVVYQYALQNRISMSVLGLGLNEIYAKNRTHDKKIKKIKRILHDEQIQRALKTLDFRHFTCIWKLFFFCAKYKFSTFFYIMLHGVEMMRKRKGGRDELGANTSSTSRYDYESRWT
ncbi:glycosyltransferase [Alkalihalobacillus hemicellulosilyticus]|uniref:Glycosyltransferase n=1 Tax=Halalkalibacter hemicellulosilyticusJCM 9152 TaxID=1236971 RepID=W4QED0_9BACI|nr:glycosyltransferase [Halalkalibacter hemicellulosilyticus]GAE30023.1 glycosyltransferase [Halalkalibacter hemicellulosilyticusJCM 9152]